MADQGDETKSGTNTEESETDTDEGVVPQGTVELLALLDAQYGDRFDTARRDQLRDGVASHRENGATLREVALENGDEPAVTFAAYRGAE